MEGRAPVLSLPTELLHRIFLHLDSPSLDTVRKVSRRWEEVASPVLLARLREKVASLEEELGRRRWEGGPEVAEQRREVERLSRLVEEQLERVEKLVVVRRTQRVGVEGVMALVAATLTYLWLGGLAGLLCSQASEEI